MFLRRSCCHCYCLREQVICLHPYCKQPLSAHPLRLLAVGFVACSRGAPLCLCGPGVSHGSQLSVYLEAHDPGGSLASEDSLLYSQLLCQHQVMSTVPQGSEASALYPPSDTYLGNGGSSEAVNLQISATCLARFLSVLLITLVSAARA